MSDVIRLGKRAFAWVTVLATISWSVGLAAFIAPMTAQAADLADGDLIKGSLPSVYYYNGGKRYTFPTQKTFLTWYTPAQLEGVANGGLVKTISNAELAAVPLSGNVTYKPGVKMVKITTDPKVYAVDAGGTLRWIVSEEAAVSLYGAGWASLVEDVPDAFFTNYKMGADISTESDFHSAEVAGAATSIAVDMGMSSTPTTPTTPTPAGGSLMLSAPAQSSMTLVADTGNTSGAQRAKVGSFTFTAGTSAVDVSKLVFRRSGIAADGDLDDMYLYSGKTLLAQVQSVSKGAATFSKAGLLSVPAGSSKTVDLWVDVNKDASAGITIAWGLAAADVTSTADSVSGSASTAQHTVAVVTDLAYLDIANVSPGTANTTDPQDDYDAWRFRLDANSQDMLVESITLTNVGSTAANDLQNFELWQGGTQLGSTVPSLTNGTVTFDLTGMEGGGYTITAGQQRQMTLRADILGGTNRTFRFGVQEATDIWVKDLNYGVYTVPAADDNAAFAVTQAGGATTINTGSLTQTIASDSPTGNVPDGATNVLFAKFNFKASGEAIKVKDLSATCSSNSATNIMKNVKLLFNGSQVGSTDASLTCDSSETSAFSFGNSFKVEAGTTGVVELRGDLTDSTVAAGETMSLSLSAGSSNANGTVSLTSISTTAISGRTLTVKSGALTVSKNASLSDYSAIRPLGVAGSSGVRLGSFVITGGAEASQVSQIVIKDDVDTTSDGVTLKDYFDNMSLKHGSTMLHTSATSLTDTDSTEYSFNISPAITIGVGETYVVDVYADMLSSFGTAVSNVNSDDTDGEVVVDSIVATGVNTGSTTSATSQDLNLQNLYIATNGSLRVTLDGDAPTDQQLVLGSTDQVLAKFKLAEESNAEDVLVKRFTVVDSFSATGGSITSATGTLRNLKLYNGSTLLGTVANIGEKTTVMSSGAAVADFDLTGLASGGFTVNKGTSVVLTLKSDLTPWTENNGTSSTHRATLFVGDYDGSTAAKDDFIDAVGLGSGYAISTTNAAATSGLVIGVSSGTTQTRLNGNSMDAVATKLSIAYSDDTGKVSPSGAVSKNSAQTVAIFKVSNTANVGGYTATLKNLNLDINQSGISITADRLLYIYKDSIGSNNQLATTTFDASANLNISDTAIREGDFTDLEISAGGYKYVYVTLDTSDNSVGSNDSLSVGIATAVQDGQAVITWSDGKSSTDYTEVNGLPLTGRTMTY